MATRLLEKIERDGDELNRRVELVRVLLEEIEASRRSAPKAE